MKLLLTPEALSVFNQLKETKPKEAEQVREIIKDIISHPQSGKGSPLALTGSLSGLWCRDYGVFRQIVYSYSEEEVKVFAIGKNLIDTEASSGTPLKQTQYTEEEYRSVLNQMDA